MDYKKDGWYVIAYCPFGPHIAKAAAKDGFDEGARTDALSEMRQHILTCEDSPNREITDMDRLRDKLFSKSDD